MSIESAKAFIEKMNTDAEFARRTGEQRGKEQIASFLKAEGYKFSEAEYEEVATELSDESLDNVVGGRIYRVQDYRR